MVFALEGFAPNIVNVTIHLRMNGIRNVKVI
jgi:hypothetical protein